MTPVVVTPEAEVRGGVVDRDSSRHNGKPREVALPSLGPSELKRRVDELRARLIEARVRMMMGAGVQVFVRGGQLMLRILTPIPAMYRGFALHPDDPDDPYVFRIDLSLNSACRRRVWHSAANLEWVRRQCKWIWRR